MTKPIMTGFDPYDPEDDDPDKMLAIRLTPEAVEEALAPAPRPWWRRAWGWMKGESHGDRLQQIRGVPPQEGR